MHTHGAWGLRGATRQPVLLDGGGHGAAFANLVFCKKDTKIVEIKPTNRPNLVSRTISETQNLNFNLIETEVLPEDQKKDGDIILNKNLLDKYL